MGKDPGLGDGGGRVAGRGDGERAKLADGEGGVVGAGDRRGLVDGPGHARGQGSCHGWVTARRGVNDGVDVVELERLHPAVQEDSRGLIDRRRHVGRQVEAVEHDRSHPAICDQAIEEHLAGGQDSRRGDHGSGHVCRLGAGVDDLNCGDIVVESAVVGRRVGDDDLAGSVNRDGPLVACSIRTRDNLTLIAQDRTVRVIVLHQVSGRDRNSLVGDRVGDVQIARSVERQEIRKCSREYKSALELLGCMGLPAPGRIGPVRPLPRGTHGRLPSQRLARQLAHRSCDRGRLPRAALPDSDAQPAKKRHARCTAVEDRSGISARQ